MLAVILAMASDDRLLSCYNCSLFFIPYLNNIYCLSACQTLSRTACSRNSWQHISTVYLNGDNSLKTTTVFPLLIVSSPCCLNPNGCKCPLCVLSSPFTQQ